MKKVILGLSLFFVFPVSILAGSILPDLNQTLEDLLKPFQNNVTKIEVGFSELNIDAVRVNAVKAEALFWKLGALNEINFNINNMSYNYNKGVRPTTTFNIELKLDLVAALGLDTINKLDAEVKEMITDFVDEATEDYGNAADINAQITKVERDAKNNLTNLEFQLSFDVDMSKLPKTKKITSVELLALDVSLAMNLQGASANVKLISNPQYRGFERDQVGLKEMLEGLLSKNKETLEEFKGAVEFIDGLANQLVNEGFNLSKKTVK